MDQPPPQHDRDDAQPGQEPGVSSQLPPEPPGASQLEPPRPLPPTAPTLELPPPSNPPGQVVLEGKAHIPAGLWWRAGAFLIDAIVLGILHQVLLYVIGYRTPDFEQLMALMERLLAEVMATGTMSSGLERDVNVMLAPLQFAGWLNVATCAAYFTVFHGMLSASLGKLCLGLSVLKRDGSPLGYGWAFLRYLGYLVVAKLAYTAWLIPLNAERRTLYDMLLGCNVFRAVPGKQ